MDPLPGAANDPLRNLLSVRVTPDPVSLVILVPQQEVRLPESLTIDFS